VRGILEMLWGGSGDRKYRGAFAQTGLSGVALK